MYACLCVYVFLLACLLVGSVVCLCCSVLSCLVGGSQWFWCRCWRWWSWCCCSGCCWCFRQPLIGGLGLPSSPLLHHQTTDSAPNHQLEVSLRNLGVTVFLHRSCHVFGLSVFGLCSFLQPILLILAAHIARLSAFGLFLSTIIFCSPYCSSQGPKRRSRATRASRRPALRPRRSTKRAEIKVNMFNYCMYAIFALIYPLNWSNVDIHYMDCAG